MGWCVGAGGGHAAVEGDCFGEEEGAEEEEEGLRAAERGLVVGLEFRGGGGWVGGRSWCWRWVSEWGLRLPGYHCCGFSWIFLVFLDLFSVIVRFDIPSYGETPRSDQQ